MRALGGWCLVSLALSACLVPIDDVSSGDGKGGSAPGGAAGSTGGSGTGGTGASTGGSAGTSTGGAAGTNNGGTGNANTGGVDSGTGGSGTCPAGMVEVNVKAGAFCIDQFEVTQEAYSKFLTGSPPKQRLPCSANDFDVPSCDWTPTTTPNRPVVCVDWCDATGFCQALGKHLCGKIGGGVLDVTSASVLQDPAQDEWYAACSHEGSLPYPYGVLYNGAKCNGIDATTISPVNVGSFPECVGGFPQLFDMSGNVQEWQAACTPSGCYTRGGSYLDLPAQLSCNNGSLKSRTTRDKAVGFRCCQ